LMIWDFRFLPETDVPFSPKISDLHLKSEI